MLLRTDLFNTLPFNSAYGAIVTAMDTSNVDTVIVAGKVVKRAGKLVGVDLDRVGAAGRRFARLSRRQARAGRARSSTRACPGTEAVACQTASGCIGEPRFLT